MGADSCDEDMNSKKLQLLPTSSFDDVARFEGNSLEAAKNFLNDNKVTDQFVESTVNCCITDKPKFQMGVLGSCV